MAIITPLTKSEIFSAYNRIRAFARKHPEIIDPARVNRALGILQSKSYYAGERAEYQPSEHSCGCKDWEFKNAKRRGYTGACKHMIAELMFSDILAMRKAHNVTDLLKQETRILEELGF